MPTAEEIFTNLQGGQKFSKLDLNGAYLQIELDDESKELLRDFGIRLIPDKCEFLTDKVDYFGFVLSARGIEPNPPKFEVVMNMPRPRNRDELLSFMGMVNYYRKFIPEMATLCYPLNELLKSGVVWFCFYTHRHTIQIQTAWQNAQYARLKSKKFTSSKEPLNVILTNFLLYYRGTPHSVTGISPAWLFFGRELRNRLDLLKRTSNTDHKEKSKPTVGLRQYNVGDTVLVRDYANPDRPVWVQGVTLKCVTSITYLMKVNDLVWKCHIDQ
ncbi:hypothetical protein QYM36_006296 [Artemia franciscana]|uniref:Uncharacterized protein n=1 Tax=Artemia franciscana TaxID=6661 RepID=A0AA88I013_ARTSF|nr:hypothetical protein QYM36_006296 [Artemia franciscana]